MNETKLKKLATNSATYKRGQAYFGEGRVKSVSGVQQPEGIQIEAYVEGHQLYKVQMNVDTKKDLIDSVRCTCPRSYAYPGLCKHSIATLLEWEAKDRVALPIKKAMPQSGAQQGHAKENPILQSLLHQYESMPYRGYEVGNQAGYETEEVAEGRLKLKPSFSYDEDGGISLMLHIGEAEWQLVRNLGECFEAIRNRSLVSGLRGIRFAQGVESFVIAYQGLVEGLINWSATCEKGNLEGDAMTLPLTLFKQWFQWVKVHPEQVVDTGQYQWTTGKPPIHFQVNETPTQFVLTFEGKEVPSLYYGGQYMAYSGKLYPVSGSYRQRQMPIVEALLRDPQHQFVFDKSDWTKVKRYLLGAIKEDTTLLISEESLETYSLPDLETKLYLDLANSTTLTAKVHYQYGEEVYNPSLKQVAPEAIRDTYKEAFIEQVLEQAGFVSKGKEAYTLKGEEALYDFVTEGSTHLMGVAALYVSDKLKQAKVRQVKSVAMGVKLKEDWIDLDFGALGIPKEELGKLLEAYRVKRKFYRLKNGEFVDLTGEGLEDLSQVTQALNLSDKDLEKDELRIPRYRALYLERLLKEESSIKHTRDKGFKNLVNAFQDLEEEAHKLPAHLEPILRSYQAVGYKWMKMLGKYHFGGILADDMGLGKTLQTIALLCSEQEDGHEQGTRQPSLIVCPTSLVFNWVGECEKFAPNLKVQAIQGSLSQRVSQLEKMEDYDVVVTSYDLLKRDLEYYERVHFNYCIIDEAQYIKNSQTQNAKAVKAVVCSNRMALTGTPIENRLGELWSIFDFVMPGYLYSETQFSKTFENPIVKDKDERALARLKQMIAPFILRRLKKEVLEELPDKTENTVYMELDDQQHKVYMSYAVQAKKELMAQIQEEGIEKAGMKMLACLTRLRQICCEPSLFLENYTGGSGKLESCLELVERATSSGHKVLLFSQFTTMLEILANRLQQEGISYSVLKGDVKASRRQEMVDQFNTGDTQVFLISLKAGGVGLNLTGADIVIHYDPWWNLSAQNQATDRAYRIGQLNNVQVYKLITKGTIEEKIKKMQDAKQDLTEQVLSTEQTMINKLSKEEILELFE
ncbi:MAG: DEAD/DEAH box helicase [Niameybacter sp.]|uniref:DEAD/DEAH box helicase n=1 Tax=Niameybacter sp. TaxID=2033640 RepID=UPI002FC6E367